MGRWPCWEWLLIRSMWVTRCTYCKGRWEFVNAIFGRGILCIHVHDIAVVNVVTDWQQTMSGLNASAHSKNSMHARPTQCKALHHDKCTYRKTNALMWLNDLSCFEANVQSSTPDNVSWQSNWRQIDHEMSVTIDIQCSSALKALQQCMLHGCSLDWCNADQPWKRYSVACCVSACKDSVWA